MVKQETNLIELRREAEIRYNQEPATTWLGPIAGDLTELIEELRIHQIELEMQNEELRHSRDRYQVLCDSYQAMYNFAPVGYFILNQDGVIMDVNFTGAYQLGVDRTVLQKQNFSDYIAWDSQDAFFMYRLKLLKTNGKHICELRLTRKDGTSFYGLLESVVIEDERSGMPKIQMALIDVTARKQAEAAQKEYNDHLEALVADRTIELLQINQQLQAEIMERQQAQATLQTSYERLEQTLIELKATQQQLIQQERLAAVGQLAAGIAHDFNNILTSIIGNAELLQTDQLAAASNQQNAAVIVKAGRRAADLVRQILDFSRISIRQTEAVELSGFLEDVARFLERTIPESIKLTLNREPGEYWVNADPTQLQQVLTNLAVNGRDAMPAGGVLTLSLSLFVLEPDAPPLCRDMLAGLWFVLKVSDTGSGIPADVLPHIFEPFFTTKELGQGTGLGLAQVYGIIEQHAGCIQVESESDIGTTFNIYLRPLKTVAKLPARAASSDLPRGQGETILVVEDEVEVLNVVQMMLKSLNYKVLTANGGKEALAIYGEKKSEIAIVLTDMIMPELDGLDLLRTLQADNPCVKVILMTGYPLREDAEQLILQGDHHWIQKPLFPKDLARVISQALGRTEASAILS